MKRERFECNEIYSVTEDEDTSEEEQYKDSLTIYSAIYREPRLLSISSDDSGLPFGDTDSEERDTRNDPGDETDSCVERVTGKQELENSLQPTAMCL